MDDLDRRLIEAWGRRKQTLVDKQPVAPIPAGEGAARGKHAGRTYTRPVRSQCLVLRASDRRVDELSDEMVVPAGYVEVEPGHERDVQAVRVNAGVVSRLCGPVSIFWPGVSVAQAARRFGVNPTTVRRWAKRGLVVMDRDVNRADPKRSTWRVWTRQAVDPSGQVWSGPWWGGGAGHLAESIPQGFGQTLLRTHRCLGAKSIVWEWLCAGCGRRAAKVYRPVEVLTVGKWLGEQETGAGDAVLLGEGRSEGRFVCRRCVGLIYESSERTSQPERGRGVNVWDRFVKRVSGGVLRGRDVEFSWVQSRDPENSTSKQS